MTRRYPKLIFVAMGLADSEMRGVFPCARVSGGKPTHAFVVKLTVTLPAAVKGIFSTVPF